MTTRQLGRKSRLVLGQAGALSTEFSEEFDYKFDIQRVLRGSPNKGSIELSNPPRDAVAALRDADALVRLYAGYSSARLIFEGSPVANGINYRKAAGDGTSTLQIEAQEGGNTYAFSQLNVTFSEEVTLRRVFEAAADSLGLDLGFIEDLKDVRFPQGISLIGPTARILDRISDMGDVDWTTQGGLLELIPVGGDVGEEAVVFSEVTRNLLSITDKGGGNIEIVGTLDGRVRPGRRFVVEYPSESRLSGIYKATACIYSGDTGFGDDFEITVIGRPTNG